MISERTKMALLIVASVVVVAALSLGMACGSCDSCKGDCETKADLQDSPAHKLPEMTAQEKAAAKKVEAAGVGYLTASALSHKIKSGQPPVIIDVLSPESYREMRIKGAINIPYNKVKTLTPQVLPDKTAEIVVYCGSYQCGASLTVAKTLKELGYTNIHDYKGGIMEWQEKNMPIEGAAAKEKVEESAVTKK